MDKVNWDLEDAKNLRHEDMIRIFKALKKEPDDFRVLVTIAYNAALRVAEAVHLRAGDFNPTTKKVSVLPLKKTKAPKAGNLTPMPLPKRIETVIPQEAMDSVMAYIKKRKIKPTGYLFPNPRAKWCEVVWCRQRGAGHESKRVYQQAFQDLLKRLRLYVPGRGIHVLKHARLTHVARKTRDPWQVKTIGRHSSVGMSDKYVRFVEMEDSIEDIGGLA